MEREPSKPAFALFLTEEQAEAVTSAISRFLLLVGLAEESSTPESRDWYARLQEVLDDLNLIINNRSSLHPADIKALMKLAELNDLQRRAGQTQEKDRPNYQQICAKFGSCFYWFQHRQVDIHQDRSDLWRLGTWSNGKQKETVQHPQEAQMLFQSLEGLATTSNLLCPRDVEALSTLAALNQTQQEADRLPSDSEEKEAITTRFQGLHGWLTSRYHYPIHRDSKTRLWRMGTEIGKKDD